MKLMTLLRGRSYMLLYKVVIEITFNGNSLNINLKKKFSSTHVSDTKRVIKILEFYLFIA